MASSCSTAVRPTGRFQATCGSRFCEPYVLVMSIDLRPARPEIDAFLYGPWQSAHPENTADVVPLIWQESVWKLHVIAPPIAKPDDVIILVALMEHLEGDPGITRLMIKQAVIDALNASARPARETLIARLIDHVNRAVDWANGGPNVTSAVEMALTAENLRGLRTNGCCSFLRSFPATEGSTVLASS